jgi:hypothetical protein
MNGMQRQLSMFQVGAEILVTLCPVENILWYMCLAAVKVV